MHLYHLSNKAFCVRSLLLTALLIWMVRVTPAQTRQPAQAQNRDPYWQIHQTRSCVVRAGQYICPQVPMSGAVYGAESLQPGSLVNERAETQSWPQQLEPTAQPAIQHYQPAPIAHPDNPDQSELLKNSKDPDFILRNFKTMFIQLRGIDLFESSLIAAELGKNPEFRKMNIHIVDDPRVADTVLEVSYNFAWDYPFKLRHQNTTTVLLAGKGEGPFSGPLGAWDVARQFVNAAKKWRTPPDPKTSTDQKPQPEEKK